MKYVSFRVVEATTPGEALHKVEAEAFDESDPLSDKISVLHIDSDGPAEWDRVEVHPVWTDGKSCEICDEGEEAFWSVYLHQKDGGIICMADLPTKDLAESLANLIDKAANTRVAEKPKLRKISQMTDDELATVGDMIGFLPKVAISKGRRFTLGMKNQLKNWDYEEFFNFGDMHQVVAVFKYLQSINVEI